MQPRKRIAFVVATLLLCVGCDQKTKSLARNALRGEDPKSFLADTVRLDYAENSGGFLGLGASLWESVANDSVPRGLFRPGRRVPALYVACISGRPSSDLCPLSDLWRRYRERHRSLCLWLCQG